MPKFRKKPVVIEAEQYLGEPIKGVCDDLKCHINFEPIGPHLHTIHNGQMVALAVGDYVIPESDGLHFYPCKPDIFAATYESAEPGKPIPCDGCDGEGKVGVATLGPGHYVG